jgi:hypothetical protein
MTAVSPNRRLTFFAEIEETWWWTTCGSEEGQACWYGPMVSEEDAVEEGSGVNCDHSHLVMQGRIPDAVPAECIRQGGYNPWTYGAWKIIYDRHSANNTTATWTDAHSHAAWHDHIEWDGTPIEADLPNI